MTTDLLGRLQGITGQGSASGQLHHTVHEHV